MGLSKKRFLIDLLPLKNVSERSLPSVVLKHWKFINFETLDTASWNIKLYWNQHFLTGSSESWNTGYTLELLFNPIKRIVQPDQANLELLHCHLSTPRLNIVFVKPQKINKQAERDSAAKKEKCLMKLLPLLTPFKLIGMMKGVRYYFEALSRCFGGYLEQSCIAIAGNRSQQPKHEATTFFRL